MPYDRSYARHKLLAEVVNQALGVYRNWGRWVDLSELLQAGSEGMLQAFEKWIDEEKNGSLEAYAGAVALHTMMDAVRESMYRRSLSPTEQRYIRRYWQQRLGGEDSNLGQSSIRKVTDETESLIKTPVFYGSTDDPIDGHTVALVDKELLEQRTAEGERSSSRLEGLEKWDKEILIERALILAAPRESQVIRMHAGIGSYAPMSYEEIGEELGLPAEVVRSTYHNGRGELEVILSGLLNGSFDLAAFAKKYPARKSVLYFYVKSGLPIEDSQTLAELRAAARQKLDHTHISYRDKQMIILLYGLDGERTRNAVEVGERFGVSDSLVQAVAKRYFDTLSSDDR